MGVSFYASAKNIADHITWKELIMDHKAIRITLVSIFFVLSSILMSACGAQAVSPSNPAQSAAAQAPAEGQAVSTATHQPTQPALSADSAKDAIIFALQALFTQTNSMQVTTTLADGSTQDTVINFVPPDRKQIIDNSSGIEYIIIGQAVYSKDPAANQWLETSIPASTFMGDDSQTQQNIGDSISEIQVLPPTSSDGKSYHVVRYLSTTTTNGIDLHSQTELWLGESDGLAYKMITDGETYVASTDPATGESKAFAVQAQTTTTITYDPQLTIEAPIP